MSHEKILVVEDEMIVAKDLQNKLLKLGYEVPAIVSSGEDAIEKAGEIKPDLILMDIVLKGKIDGIRAAVRITSIIDIPVVYLTAYIDDDTVERAKKTGPFGYIVKPFEDKDLYANIEVALYKHKFEKNMKTKLQQENKELKVIRDLAIGRELKMIELKQRIKELESRDKETKERS